MASGRMRDIEQFQQFEQGASAVGCGAVSDLANDDVLVETVELAHAGGQQLEQRGHGQAAQQANRGRSLAGLAGAQDVAQIVDRGLSEFTDEFDNAIAFDALLRAEETVGKVFNGVSGEAAAGR